MPFCQGMKRTFYLKLAKNKTAESILDGYFFVFWILASARMTVAEPLSCNSGRGAGVRA